MCIEKCRVTLSCYTTNEDDENGKKTAESTRTVILLKLRLFYFRYLLIFEVQTKDFSRIGIDNNLLITRDIVSGGQ